MKLIKIMEDLKFDNGTIIEDYHSQDCCESVYADFEYLKEMNILPATGETISIYDIEFDENIENCIEQEEGTGFKLIAKDGSKWLIPCHNIQNGYYNDQLELKIIKKDAVIIIDISNCTRDEIY